MGLGVKLHISREGEERGKEGTGKIWYMNYSKKI